MVGLPRVPGGRARLLGTAPKADRGPHEREAKHDSNDRNEDTDQAVDCSAADLVAEDEPNCHRDEIQRNYPREYPGPSPATSCRLRCLVA